MSYLLDHAISIVNELWIGDMLISFLLQCDFRVGVRDAFQYKKSKTRIRKDNQQLSIWRKILLVYPSSIQCFAPYHMKMFQLLRVCHIAFCVSMGVILFFSQHIILLKQIVLAMMIIKDLVFDSAYICYGLYMSKPHSKAWDFSRSKRP